MWGGICAAKNGGQRQQLFLAVALAAGDILLAGCFWGSGYCQGLHCRSAATASAANGWPLMGCMPLGWQQGRRSRGWPLL